SFARGTEEEVEVGEGVVIVSAVALEDDDDRYCAHGIEVCDTPTDEALLRSAELSAIPGRAARLRLWKKHVRYLLDPNERRFLLIARAHVRRVYGDVIVWFESQERGLLDDLSGFIAKATTKW